MRTIKSLTNNFEKVYIVCKSRKCAMQFLINAEDEGITVGALDLPTNSDLSDMYCLHSDGTVWHVGAAGRIKYHFEAANIVCIDYEKYSHGDNDYFISSVDIHKSGRLQYKKDEIWSNGGENA